MCALYFNTVTACLLETMRRFTELSDDYVKFFYRCGSWCRFCIIRSDI